MRLDLLVCKLCGTVRYFEGESMQSAKCLVCGGRNWIVLKIQGERVD